MKTGCLIVNSVGFHLCDLVSHSCYQTYCNNIVLSPVVSGRNYLVLSALILIVYFHFDTLTLCDFNVNMYDCQ